MNEVKNAKENNTQDREQQSSQDKSREKKRNWRRIMWLLVLGSVMYLAAYPYDAIKNDPNLILKKISREVTEDSPVDVSYRYKTGHLGKKRIPFFSFTPGESAEYTFSVTDIESEEDVVLAMEVTDSHLNNYLNVDNIYDRSSEFSATAFLTEGNTCYIAVEAISVDAREEYSGSFSLNVSKAPEGVLPNEVTESDPAVVKISGENQSAVLFVPEESGFFRFNSVIISEDKSAYSGISSVISADNEEVKRSEGISYLEGGKEYYIWVSAHDLSKPYVKAKVSCKRIETLSADQPGEYSISEDTIIEFNSNAAENLAIYSVSDGDVIGYIYDGMGFPLNSDDNSGGDLSGNEKDFALVIQAQSKSRYLIYAGGKFSECSIVIARYTGDGSSIGKGDIETEEVKDVNY